MFLFFLTVFFQFANFNVRTSDAEAYGRGYVWAVWMFHYEEIYREPRKPLSPQYVKEPAEYEAGNDEKGYWSAINHEIDIEIPANSPQFKGNWTEQYGWDTINLNTWIGDNQVLSIFTH